MTSTPLGSLAHRAAAVVGPLQTRAMIPEDSSRIVVIVGVTVCGLSVPEARSVARDDASRIEFLRPGRCSPPSEIGDVVKPPMRVAVALR